MKALLSGHFSMVSLALLVPFLSELVLMGATPAGILPLEVIK